MKILVACSGGPDSMALLDRSVQAGYSIVVAHINYKKRKSADRDEEIVKTYCKEHGLPCFVNYPIYPGKGNFQAWARAARYSYFETLMKQEGIHDLFVAHHMDDAIETYVFQKQRKMLCDHYGLVPRVHRHFYTIHRPLLSYEKKELERYCIDHSIPYGIDETNLTDHYTRNQIRHQQIATMDRKKKEVMIDRIEREDRCLRMEREQMRARIEREGITALLKEEKGWFALDLYLSDFIHRHLGKAHLISLCSQLASPCLIEIDDFFIERWQEKILVVQKRDLPIFSFDSLDSLSTFKSLELGNFKYSFNNKGEVIEGVTLSASDLPLTLRPAKNEDGIKLRWGTKRMKRFWIDRKVPKVLRREWYILENKEHDVIFVPGIGCDVLHFSIQPNTFMLQLTI